MRTYLLPLIAALTFPATARGAPPAAAPPARPSLAQLHFQFDSAVVDRGDRAELERATAWLGKHPHLYLVIEGHTDAIGTYAYNAGLGVRRAEAVRAALVKLGADPARLVVAVYGEADPVSTVNADNRRVIVRGTRNTLAQIQRQALRKGMAVVWGYHPTGRAAARNRDNLRRFFAG
jgi:hypothetical protein